jgi:hypothetical protein
MGIPSDKDHVFVAVRQAAQRVEGDVRDTPGAVNGGEDQNGEHGENLSSHKRAKYGRTGSRNNMSRRFYFL